MRRVILFHLFLLFFGYSFSQNKTGAGYYITNEHDTIRGYIEYRNNYNTEFKFRVTPKARSKIVASEDVIGFTFLNSRVFQTLDFASELTNHPVFAQVLLTGDIDVYRHHGKLLVDGGGINKFRFEKAKPKPDDEAKENYQKNVGYFNILFHECPEVLTKARTVGISSNRLIDWVEEYHDCKNIPYTKLLIKEKKQIDFGISVGFSKSTINYPPINVYDYKDGYDPYGYLGRSIFEQSPPSMAISFHYIYRGRRPAAVVAFQQELSFAKASFSGKSNDAWQAPFYTGLEKSTTTIKFSMIDYKFGLRFTARSNLINPYIGFGLAFTQFIKKVSTSDVTYVSGNTTRIGERNPLEYKNTGGVWANVGLSKQLGRYKIFADMMTENTYLGNSGVCNTLYTRLGFLF